MTSNRMDKTEVLQTIEIPVSKRVLVSGPGAVSIFTAKELAKMGLEVILISHSWDIAGNIRSYGAGKKAVAEFEKTIEEIEGDNRIRILTATDVKEFEGSPGKFNVKLRGAVERSEQIEVGALVLAGEPQLKPNFEKWGVKESVKIKTFSWLESALNSPEKDFLSQDLPLKVIFICGFKHHSNPFSQRRAIDTAVKLASGKNNQVLFVTEHFKVAYSGMERLTRIARDAGVLFVKVLEPIPIIKSEGEKLEVSYYDDALGEEVTVEPDYIFLEEAYMAPEENTLLAGQTGVTLDSFGFFQGDNIYNRPIYTNRNGIWTVGSAKGPVSLEEGFEEAKAAALDIRKFFGHEDRLKTEERVLFDEGKCGKCLTCYRLCPHCAISFEVRPIFHHLACRACGICAAGCPGDAIQIAHFVDDEIETRIEKAVITGSGQEKEGALKIVAFCCENSAIEAARLAAFKGFKLPDGIKLIEVPCAGRVDMSHLLKAFEFGADGVAILGCHHESCKSVKGNTLAKKRVELIRGVLEETGIEKERLFFGSIAPGMSSEFEKIVVEMEKVVRDLSEGSL